MSSWVLQRSLTDASIDELQELLEMTRMLTTNARYVDDGGLYGRLMMRRVKILAELARRGEQLRLEL